MPECWGGSFTIAYCPCEHTWPLVGFSIPTADERPKLPKLLSFPGKGGIKINMPQQIGTKYSQFGVQLLNDETGEEIDAVGARKCVAN